MAFTQSIAHLFSSNAEGRKLRASKQAAADADALSQIETSIAAGHASLYIRGLMEAKSGERNLEDIADTVPGGDHQRLHHFVSNSPWVDAKVLDWVSREADGRLGGLPDSHLMVDESGYSKKGNSSVGVARQYNGRLGKVDNCQVGVFAALAAGDRVTLLEGRMYLTETWCDDPARCDKAKVPQEARTFQSKAQIALELVRTQRARGVRFNWVSMDAGYGKDPALLRALEDEQEVFVADVHADQRVWLDNPQPAVPQGRGPGKKPTRLKAAGAAIEVRQWAAEQSAERWVKFKRREGINGPLRGDFMHQRVWLWDGREDSARLWHLIAWRPEESPQQIKYILCNAAADTPQFDLARMACSRFWVERALQDAKGALGMGEYQLRGWVGWHHHMSLVMLAMLFMVQQKILLATEAPLLSSEDIVWVLEKYLPRAQVSQQEVQADLDRRRRRRRADIDSRRRRNPPVLEDNL